GDRNYPLEWTRLMGLVLHYAEMSLALGDPDGGRLLISVHGQLETLLGARAPESLRSALLPRGRRLLEQAITVWGKQKEDALVREAETIVATWPRLAALPSAGWPGSVAELEKVFAGPRRGLAIQAEAPVRVLDLLCLPIPDAGVEAALAFLNPDSRLTEVAIF